MSFPATVAEADAYLTDERSGASKWFTSGADKALLLRQAYNTIRLDPDYSIPTSPDSTQLERLTFANIELAFHLLSNPQNRRQDLINQGVKKFTIGKFTEEYETTKQRDAEGYSKYPVTVADLLNAFLRVSAIGVTITRKQENII